MTDVAADNGTPEYRAASRAQAIAADPAHSAWVSANAGSGKTKVLIDRVARLLLLKEAKPESILCITYTRAAANEMLQRLFDRLGTWSVMAEEPLRRELAGLEGRTPESYDSSEIAAARALFARAVETPGGLRIETIHAFCARVLRRFPLEAGMLPGFEEVDEAEAKKLWQEAVRLGLGDMDRTRPDLLDAVSREGGGFGAMAAIGAIRAHAPMIGRFRQAHGEDTGRIEAALAEALGPPEEDEATLVDRAMGEALPVQQLRAAVALLEQDGKRDSKRTAEAISEALALSNPQARWAAYRSGFFGANGLPYSALYNKGAAGSALITGLFGTKDIPEGTEVQRVRALDAAIRARRAFERSLALLALAGPVLSRYRALKRARAVADFDDLVAFTRDLLTAREAAAWVLYKLDGGLTHVLLDEAQDTSPDQWELLNALSAEFFAGAGSERSQDPRTLFIVGDEKQSIYAFQGADPQRFAEERQAFEARTRAAFGTAHLPDMAMSFRSSPEILAFVDMVSASGDIAASPQAGGPPGDLDLMRHTARRRNEPGRVELWPLDKPPPHEEPVPWDAPRDSVRAADPRRLLARKVAREVRAMVDRGETVWKQGRRVAMLPGDVLILVQKRGAVFESLISALKAEGLPVAGADRLVLADDPGVQDLLNLMRFVILPEDDLTLAEIIRGPFGGMVDDDTHLFALAHDRGEASLWSRLEASAVADHRDLARWLRGLQALSGLPPFEFLGRVLDQPGETGLTGWERLAARLGPPARDPVAALLSRALAHDAWGPASLQRFLAAMDLDRSEIKRDLAAPSGEIRVMTVHGAKGLQAPVVILPGTAWSPRFDPPGLAAVSGVPVWMKSAEEDTAIMTAMRDDARARAEREDRRLLYVALTRAEDRLILCGAWDRRYDNAGHGKKAWHALCAEAMARLVPGGPGPDGVFAYGDPVVCAPGTGPAEPPPVPVPDWLMRPARAESPKGRVAPASGLVRDGTPVLPPSLGHRTGRLKRGRLIHALLERLPALPAADRRSAGQAFLERDRSLTAGARTEMLGAALGVLRDARFADVFAEGGRAEAAVIGTAPSLPAGLIVNGRVDRLVIRPGRILIVDFKTDRPAPARAEDVGRAYLLQMAAYRAVLAQAWPGRRIEAALVWTDGPVLMPLPEDLLEESLSQASVLV